MIEAQGGAYDFATFEAHFVKDAKLPVGRIGLPTDIANAVAFLASTLAGFITGANLRVDGGMIPTVN